MAIFQHNIIKALKEIYVKFIHIDRSTVFELYENPYLPKTHKVNSDHFKVNPMANPLIISIELHNFIMQSSLILFNGVVFNNDKW